MNNLEYLAYPTYFDSFKCIANKCRDNCCIGWEIDIDEETYKQYMKQSGDFGQRLRDNIDDDNQDGPCFILGEYERCPFLNENNLCDIYINMGKDSLCQICTDHPRFYDWLSTGVEAGVGLCCEAAARLILETKVDKNYLVCREYGSLDACEIEYLEYREEIFEIIVAESSHDEKLREVSRIDTKEFICGKKLVELFEFLSELEINDTAYSELLCNMKSENGIDKIVRNFDIFTEWYSEQMWRFDSLLQYFVYRHFLKARFDDDPDGKLIFAGICTLLVRIIAVYSWNGIEFAMDQLIDIAKMVSKELEYSEDNTLAIQDCDL